MSRINAAYIAAVTKFPRKHPHPDFPNTLDSGKRLHAGKTCHNCGSPMYFQTVSIEYCPSCGMFCDYWGLGANDVYNAMSDRRAAQEAREAELAAAKYEDEQ